MNPYYDHKGIIIYHGDCREVLPTLPNIPLFVTSPPYNLGSRYANITPAALQGKWSRQVTYTSWTDNLPEEEYVAWQQDVIRLMWNSLTLWGGDFLQSSATHTEWRVLAPIESYSF
jgi:DNA modification methylase